MKKKILTVLAFSLCLTFFSGIDTNILKAEENTTEVEENQDNSNKNDEGTEVLPLDESQTENDTISEENDVTSKETNDTKSSEPIYEEGYYTVGDNGEIEYIDLTPPTEEDDNVNQKNLARSTELGLLKLRTKGSASYITSYSDINGKSGYLNGYYAGDAAYLGNVTGGVKFKVAGTIGTMAPTENHNGVVKNNYKIVPLSNVKSASYYYVSNGLLYHRVAADIEVVDSYLNTTGTPIGVAPSYLSTGTKYYSYDGHYFYTTLQQMINDYKGNIYANSVNPNNVYYSYYQYLNTRSKTTLTASELNAAVRRHTSSGVMLDKSSSFISAQNTNGVNALLATAHAALESNWGRSDMAVSKNNIFGINAGDLDPSGANKFPSVEKCIAAYSEMISIDFCDPKDGLGRYFGGHYGDKASGINVKYASDPYLGEKVGSIALSLDSSRKDLDYYQLAVNEGNNLVAVRKDASQSATSLYTNSNIRSYPVIVLQKNGSFQQIQSDAVLKSDRSGILQDVATYNFSYMYGYVDSSTFKDINVGKNEINTGIKIDSTEILDSDATGFTVKVTTSGGNGLKRVRIPVWTDKNWQDDLVWYEGVVNGNVATCRVELKNHNYEEGLYHVHAYAYDNDDKKFIYNTTTNVTKPKFQIDSTEILDSDATGFTVKVTTSNGNGLKRVRIPVWTDKNGQDDLVWYEGIVVGNTATYRVNVKNHNYEDGLYHVHAYAYDNDDKKFIYNTTTTVKIPPLKIDSTEILDSDETGFTVKVTTSGGSGLTRVRIPVWTDKNWQDDLVWYEGVVKGNTATYRVNVKNHNYEEGLYHVHAYAYDKGNRKFIYNTTTNVTIPKFQIDSTEILDSDATGFTVKVTTSNGNGLKRVRIPVWTDKNWQDDLVWYEGIVVGNTATYRVDVKNHNYEDGLYHVHAYAYDNDDKKFIYNTTTTVKIPPLKIDSTEILDSDETGFTVKVTTSGGSGLTRVRIPVWTDKNWQDDLVWYEGVVKGNTATYRVNVKNHNYEEGLYHVHAYAYDKGNRKFIYNTTTNVTIPKFQIDSTEIYNLDETGFNVKVTTSNGNGLKRVRIPVWTDKNWQDDLVWYEGIVVGNTATYRVDVKNHNYEDGLYHVHAYAYDNDDKKFIYNTTTTVKIPPLKIDSTEILDSDETGFTVKVTTSGGSGLTRVRIPVWTDKNWQDDLVWYEGVVKGNTATYRVNVKNHNYEEGLYHVHAYAYDKGNRKFIYNTTTNVTIPKFQIDSTEIYNLDETGFDVKVTTSNGTGLKRVRIPVWTEKNGQDDLIWYEGIVKGNTATCRVNISDHKNESGKYIVHAYAYDNDDKKFIYNTETVVPSKVLEITSVTATKVNSYGYEITVKVNDPIQIKEVKVPAWTMANGQDDVVWHNAKIVNGQAKVFILAASHNYEKGTYINDVYVYGVNGDRLISRYNVTLNSVSAKMTGWKVIEGEKYFFDKAGVPFGNAPALKVIDVSEWQKEIDWNKVKASDVDAVILRLGYGSAYEDKYFARNVRECRRLNIPFGVYLYSYAETGPEGKLEGEFVVRTLKKYGITSKELFFPVYYDLEAFSIGSTPIYVPTNSYISIVHNFVTVTRNGGYNPHLYSYRSYLNSNLRDSRLWQYVSWAAAYTDTLGWSNPYYSGSFGWQYSSSGSVPGINGSVDMNCWVIK